MVLLKGPSGWLFLTSEVPLQRERVPPARLPHSCVGPQRFHLTQCINCIVLESQLPTESSTHCIVNNKLTIV